MSFAREAAHRGPGAAAEGASESTGSSLLAPHRKWGAKADPVCSVHTAAPRRGGPRVGAPRATTSTSTVRREGELLIL